MIVATKVAADPGPVWLSLNLDGTQIEFSCLLRRQTSVGQGAWDLGLEFEPGQEQEIARLAVALFHPAVPPHSAGEKKPLASEPVWRSAAAARRLEAPGGKDPGYAPSTRGLTSVIRRSTVSGSYG